MAYRIHERIFLELGPYRTLPGMWWIKISDKELTLLTPLFAISLYNWAYDVIRIAKMRGWRFAWGRAPLMDGGPLYLHERERLEYRVIR